MLISPHSTDTDVAADNGTVTFAKNLTLSGAPVAIAATNGGVVTGTNKAAAKMVTGNITSDGAGSLVDTNFATADSYFTGATTVSNTGEINLDFENGAPWNVTADSSLTNLVNNSTVNMKYTGRSTNETLTVGNLSGNGTYVINTDLEGSYNSKDVRQNGDKIIITSSSSGNGILDLKDVSLYKKLASQGYLLLVEDQSNGSATFTGKDLYHGGIFKYKPLITTANPTDYTNYNSAARNWYLTGFEKLVEVSDNTNATLGLNETRYGSYFTDNDTLLKRLGELRMMKGQPEDDGFWMKLRHGTMEGKKFDGNFTTVQAGYDKKTSQKRYTGLAYSHTDNSFTLGAGTGEGSLDALTVYNTWLGDKNHYFDIVGKVGRMKGDSSYYDIMFPEQEEFSNWFYSLSGEYGRKNINNKNGWYYEPQAQLTVGRINSSDYTTSMGTKVHMGAINSVLGRAGVTVGREYNRDNPNKHSNVYAKVNVLHEFRGDITTSLLDTYGDSYEPTAGYGGTWLNAGIGATVNFNKNTHIYFDLEKNFHGPVTSKWIGQLGCRWTW
jgi:outer membrane autotransporter protein